MLGQILTIQVLNKIVCHLDMELQALLRSLLGFYHFMKLARILWKLDLCLLSLEKKKTCTKKTPTTKPKNKQATYIVYFSLG